jgi:hypothetical protein
MRPYNKGYAAAKAGESYFSNPYPPDTKDWVAWNVGFKDGQE